MVSRVCLGYIVSPYAIIYKSFDFSVMNIYIKKNRNWRINAEECGVAIKPHVSWQMIVLERQNYYLQLDN